MGRIKKVTAALLIALLALANPAGAQVTVPHTFVTEMPVSQVNTNFSTLGAGALARNGGTITGNITVNGGVTIDGVDISAALGGSGTPTFSTLTLNGAGSALNVTNRATISSTASNALDIAGGLNAGSGNVGIIDTSGRIPAISSTYFASLSGANLTGIPGSAIVPTWQSWTFNAANFGAAGGGSWTVESGDVAALSYMQLGDTVSLRLYLNTTVIAGAVGYMTVALPVGSNIGVATAGVCAGTDSGGAFTPHWIAQATAAVIQIFNAFGSANVPAGTVHLSCDITYDIL